MSRFLIIVTLILLVLGFQGCSNINLSKRTATLANASTASTPTSGADGDNGNPIQTAPNQMSCQLTTQQRFEPPKDGYWYDYLRADAFSWAVGGTFGMKLSTPLSNGKRRLVVQNGNTINCFDVDPTNPSNPTRCPSFSSIDLTYLNVYREWNYLTIDGCQGHYLADLEMESDASRFVAAGCKFQNHTFLLRGSGADLARTGTFERPVNTLTQYMQAEGGIEIAKVGNKHFTFTGTGLMAAFDFVQLADITNLNGAPSRAISYVDLAIAGCRYIDKIHVNNLIFCHSDLGNPTILNIANLTDINLADSQIISRRIPAEELGFSADTRVINVMAGAYHPDGRTLYVAVKGISNSGVITYKMASSIDNGRTFTSLSSIQTNQWVTMKFVPVNQSLFLTAWSLPSTTLNIQIFDVNNPTVDIAVGGLIDTINNPEYRYIEPIHQETIEGPTQVYEVAGYSQNNHLYFYLAGGRLGASYDFNCSQ